jgi:hypothetical protein
MDSDSQDRRLALIILRDRRVFEAHARWENGVLHATAARQRIRHWPGHTYVPFGDASWPNGKVACVKWSSA